MSLLYKYAIYAAIATAVFFGAKYWHDKQVDALVLKTQTEMQIAYDKKIIQLVEKGIESSTALENKIKEITNAKELEIAGINSSHATIVAGLRNRPNRPTSSGDKPTGAADTKGAEGATGVQLSSLDAIVLARFSRDTAELQAGLKSCYAQYDEVKYATDKFKLENPIRFGNTSVDATTSESN